MKSVTTEKFRKAFSKLPKDVQENARSAYNKWKHTPNNPSTRFKQIHPQKPIYSVRVGLSYRALDIKEEDTMVWFWIGSHEDYNNLIARFCPHQKNVVQLQQIASFPVLQRCNNAVLLRFSKAK